LSAGIRVDWLFRHDFCLDRAERRQARLSPLNVIQPNIKQDTQEVSYPMQDWRVSKGWDVYDANNEKIGEIKEVSGNHFKIDTGFLGLGKDYYIPFSAISDVSGEKVFISGTKDRLDSMGWDRPMGGITGSDEGRF
jgi:hypothetical protein